MPPLKTFKVVFGDTRVTAEIQDYTLEQAKAKANKYFTYYSHLIEQ